LNAIGCNVGVITLFQTDLDEAKEFYTAVFGKTADFADATSVTFHFDNTIINLERESAAHDLIAPATVAARESGSRFVLTIWVDDVGAASAELAERGVTLINGPIDRPWGTRTACFADPGGHIWEVAQDLGQQPGS
jgi:catechol 2,3-dioxygenase-like lactoylglutathione lyase family enzyme